MCYILNDNGAIHHSQCMAPYLEYVTNVIELKNGDTECTQCMAPYIVIELQNGATEWHLPSQMCYILNDNGAIHSQTFAIL